MGQNPRSFLLERAHLLEERALDLILTGNYEEFLTLATISENIWSGVDAKQYANQLRRAVADKDKSFLICLPERLKKIALKMPEPKKFKFDYEKLIQKSEEIDFKMIQYILDGNYAGLQKLASITEDIWSGKAADRYKNELEEAIKNYDKRFLASIPSYLRQCAEEHLKNEKAIKKVLAEKLKIKI